MIEDIDVKEIFTACDVDSESLKKELEIFLKEKLSDLVNLQLEEVKPTLGFQRVIQRAVIHYILRNDKEYIFINLHTYTWYSMLSCTSI